MSWATPRTWVDGEKIRASYFNDTLDLLRYLKGQDGPVSLILRNSDKDLIVTEDEEAFVVALRASDGGGRLIIRAYDDVAVVNENNSGISLKFIFREQGGAEVEVAKIEVTYWDSGFDSGFPPGCIMRFFVKTAGSYPASPNLTLTGDGFCGINQGGPSYTLHVVGDLDADEINGLTGVWRNNSGTITYDGPAAVSGVLTSQVATGTAPLAITDAFSDLNLNASYMQGATWGGASATGGTTATLNNLGWETAASCTVSDAGCYFVAGGIYISTADGDDEEASFLVQLSSGTAFNSILPGALAVLGPLQMHVGIADIVDATAGQTIYLYARKGEGEGATEVDGYITATYLGPTL